MEVTRVEQRAYIKIFFLRGRNAMKCHIELVEALGNNAIPCSTVAWWVGKFQQGHVSTSDEQRSRRPVRTNTWRFATREDIANAVHQQVTQFTHDAANAEAGGIQCLRHRWQHVVTVAGDYIKEL
ncbi:uncharacterized protein TNCV_1228951 [Trichonephila clavipes]|nr:uncharacterized protein TNCV_1228951 [Trichonephila clavipes]